MDTIVNIHKSTVGNISSMKKYHNEVMNEFICHFKTHTGRPQLIGGFKPSCCGLIWQIFFFCFVIYLTIKCFFPECPHFIWLFLYLNILFLKKCRTWSYQFFIMNLTFGSNWPFFLLLLLICLFFIMFSCLVSLVFSSLICPFLYFCHFCHKFACFDHEYCYFFLFFCHMFANLHSHFILFTFSVPKCCDLLHLDSRRIVWVSLLVMCASCVS